MLALLALAGCKKETTGPTQNDDENAGNGGGGSGGSAPVANFSANRTSGFAALSVSFQDLSIGDPSSWGWDFGDGRTSTTQNPTHTYLAAGTYTVTLRVNNANGSDTKVNSDYIYVQPSVIQVRHASAVSGGVRVKVNGTDYDIPRGTLITIPVSAPTSLSIWECIWVNNSWACRWDGPYTIVPGSRYKVVDASSTHWDLALTFD